MNEERTNKMKLLIDRLLREAPKMEDAPADDPGAFQCQILLRSGYRAVGALARTPEGLLKFMVIAQENGGARRVVAAEHVFDYSDVECIVVTRAIVSDGEADKPRIFTGQT
jgi:hypothetical protein